ncbi:GNAT family N-acetyltransferase [Saccharothrix algeriensis]|uniref:GNAT family N-acetyltransferase n=1 Tax=Saccharothrix algeriensis TaxID=173560 RepID=A0A8T8I4A3_9PSEU|nr:GNAT family protein [Saccharothrix algeriensis]MBM7812016.1 RimJ/RimL family protein N-acetyltransferase [Saccharothrix algeriensis]QTR05703.1 GNAT family N-acetyltransferase [Saccharothrix algeriensis]
MDPWPLRHLALRTPRLELRPDDDAGLLELADEALRGVHPPDRMPFGVEWTDAPRERLGLDVVQHHWSARASLSPRRWAVNFLVRLDGRVIGVQSLLGESFAVRREVTTGSWLGLRHQGTGLGTQMRAAVLLFAFDHLGARAARTSAFTDNPASLAVSRKLGYRPDGTFTQVRRGRVAAQTRLVVAREDFTRPSWQLAVTGVTACLELLTGREPAE